MNNEFCQYILDNDHELYGYIRLRAYYQLNCELGQTLTIKASELLQFGGLTYLRTLEGSGLIRLKTGIDQVEISLYDNGWIGFKTKAIEKTFIGNPETLLKKLIEIPGKRPADLYKNGKFNTRYPQLLSRLREHYSDEEIIKVVKATDIPLSSILDKRIFDEKRQPQIKGGREEEDYSRTTW